MSILEKICNKKLRYENSSWGVFDPIRLSRIRSMDGYIVYLTHCDSEVKEYDSNENPVYWKV